MMELTKEFRNTAQEKLTAQEFVYFMTMASGNVPFITSEPGLAKSAMMRSIADKLGFMYIDLRLSTKDETDLGVYPIVDKHSEYDVVKYCIPEWAHEANNHKVGVIIHFEELNRCSVNIRNAALGLLNEKIIGEKFRFKPHVLMCASGNLGDKDGTDTEDLDSAVNNRLVHISHTLTVDDWIDQFANKNMQSTIIEFIRANPDNFYNFSALSLQNEPAFATPRSWANFSRFIDMVTGTGEFIEDENTKKIVRTTATVDDIIKYVSLCASDYVGSSASKFQRYLQDVKKVNIDNIVKNYPKYRSTVQDFISNRTRLTELLHQLKNENYHICKLTDTQMDNVIMFLDDIKDTSKDQIISYIEHNLEQIVDVDDAENKSKKQLLKESNHYRNFVKIHGKLEELFKFYAENRKHNDLDN